MIERVKALQQREEYAYVNLSSMNEQLDEKAAEKVKDIVETYQNMKSAVELMEKLKKENRDLKLENENYQNLFVQQNSDKMQSAQPQQEGLATGADGAEIEDQQKILESNQLIQQQLSQMQSNYETLLLSTNNK